MILTDEQLTLTKEYLAKFKEAHKKVSNQSDPFGAMEKNAIESTIEQLSNEIKIYTDAQEKRIVLKNKLDINELKEQLILNRIYAGVSQDELASALNISQSTLNRLEATRYETATLSLLLKCSDALKNPIKVVTECLGGKEREIYNFETSQEIPFWELIPIKELVHNKWLSAQNAVEELKQLIVSSGSLTNFAYHKKSSFNEKSAKQAALFAWETKILSEAQNVIRENKVEFTEYNPAWISELLRLTKAPNGPLIAQQLLLEKGIVLVIEKHLQQTYLDGAAMLSEEGFPVIGMTLRHNRIDNFWFVLFHELAHVYLHLLTNKFPVFLDEKVGEGDDSDDPLENEANNFARNTLITPEKWAACVSPVMTTPKAVEIDAKNLDIHPAIVAGRIRFEKNDYTILNDFLGHGQVRQLFGVE
ncbi:ImmA/IrrE family metallo-endopeptidase [Vibrio cholerae]|uniref:helix-turn-helix domain-containing protein n=1 Tax=Vibrio cholerae TaxID=666 RepID=UPI0011D8446F|nr:helix-turn-helix domain-containing protein [Vibrio cholerae]MCR9706694.1 ImmA/IrrE family metallo-endopeptidase [Vibrio cholerae]TXZ94157.1 ImmA/IrrE family metallo-endopeptidase [Vibrio cholerae]GHX72596.1 plasmid stabilization protein [Vibrio cholerae]